MNAEKVRELFRYDEITGFLYWREHRKGCNRGKPAGCLSRRYRIIRVDAVNYPAARLIWLYQTGFWPKEVDHKDGNPSNNTWSNLREVGREEQLMNANRKVGECGVRGVTFDKSRHLFKAQIQAYGRRWSGRYNTLEEAVIARKAIEKLWHGEFAVGERNVI